ncbi:hypothetical protein [Actinoplanes sp. NPDC023714]|uniref:hypothetical protein n=1 Tax=Actinoplanes sp. NPDC023714 TaxID=3154322 RepID=UPI0034095439
MIAGTGGSGGTDWSSLRLDQMWAMVSSHDPDTHARLIGGWRQSHELAMRHLAQVRDYRERLAASWDPARNRAAAAYFARLDALIANLEETSEAAVANQRAFTGATGALQSARRQMAEIHREHTANALLLAAFAEEKRLYQLTPGKARGVPPQRPVPEGRQALLEARARAVMQALSTELAQAQSALVVPAAYEPGPAASRARIPLPRSDPARQEIPGPSSVRGRAPAPGPEGMVIGRPNISEISPGRGTSARPPAGIIGATRPPVPSRRPPTTPVPGNPIPGSPIPGDPIPAEPTLGDPTLGDPILGSPTPATRNGTRPTDSPAEGTPTTTGRQPPAGQPATRAGPLAAPIGGVIGRQPPPPHPTGHRRHHPGTPWEIGEGVDPVVEPPPEKPIDPGPAMGRTPENG